MSTKKVLLIVFASNLLLLGGLFGLFYLTRNVYALPANQPPEANVASTTAYDWNLYPRVPPKMSYQGMLCDDSGNPLDGTYTLTFKIYACDPFCGSVWTEAHPSVTVDDGLFSVVLGESTPLDPSDFTGYTYWDLVWGNLPTLGLYVDVDGTELTPRPELVSVPYAFRAEYVNRFPAPHYDSGWVSVTTDLAGNVFTHSLGGDVDNYVVDLQFKDTASSNGIHQRGYGLYHSWSGSFNYNKGAYWFGLDDTHIRVLVGGHEANINKARVRIWRTD